MNNFNKIKSKLSKESLNIIEKEIPFTLKEYLFTYILDIYNTFDKGHGLAHIATVIDSSLKLSMFYNLNKSMILTIAVFHDIGLIENRENHHIHSKNILLQDDNLHKWFSTKELKIMGEACKEHRASNVEKPQSIYGLIVSDADRTTDIYDMITRCYNFTLKHFSDLSVTDRYTRVYSHLTEKYGLNGYAKFYLEESKTVIMKPFLEAQEILKDEIKFKDIYYKLIY